MFDDHEKWKPCDVLDADLEVIKKAHADFRKKTYDQRRKQSIKLARAVVKKLETMR